MIKRSNDNNASHPADVGVEEKLADDPNYQEERYNKPRTLAINRNRFRAMVTKDRAARP